MNRTQTHCHTGAPRFPSNYTEELDQMRTVRWILIHVLMHVYILNKVWEQKWGDWDTNTLPYRGTQLDIKVCIVAGPDEDSQVDINSCTDACTHSKQGVGTEIK